MPALLYASLTYGLFVAVSLYTIGFLANMPGWPKTIDSGIAGAPGPTIAIDLALVVLFGLQHSVMARAGFKAWWTRIVPAVAERATYVLAATLMLALLLVAWQPLPGTVWRVESRPLVVVLWALFVAGWLLQLVASFLLDHCELFGLRQPWNALRGRAAGPSTFATPGLYRWVRHPIYLGFLLAFWATPMMSQGHLLLAAGMTVYLSIGVACEERDLVDRFGETYRAYRRRVPMLVPWRLP